MIGIYKIENKINKKIYIGQSSDIKERLNSHKMCREDSKIDNAIKKYGKENFTFEIIELCDYKELNRRENFYIKKFNSVEEGYNQNYGSTKTKNFRAGNEKRYIAEVSQGEDSFMLKWEEYCQAANELSPSALNLYMYLAKNKDGYEFYFSSKDYRETFNVSDRTFRNAKSELILKGYLKEKDKNKVLFSSSAAFKETKDSLKEELLKIGEMLRLENTEIYNDFKEKIADANLKSIENEYIYKDKIRNLISFGEELLNSFTEKDLNSLL